MRGGARRELLDGGWAVDGRRRAGHGLHLYNAAARCLGPKRPNRRGRAVPSVSIPSHPIATAQRTAAQASSAAAPTATATLTLTLTLRRGHAEGHVAERWCDGDGGGCWRRLGHACASSPRAAGWIRAHSRGPIKPPHPPLTARPAPACATCHVHLQPEPQQRRRRGTDARAQGQNGALSDMSWPPCDRDPHSAPCSRALLAVL